MVDWVKDMGSSGLSPRATHLASWSVHLYNWDRDIKVTRLLELKVNIVIFQMPVMPYSKYSNMFILFNIYDNIQRVTWDKGEQVE